MGDPYPLHKAVWEVFNASKQRELELVGLKDLKNLLEAGADVNERDNTSRTPLDYCMTSHGRVEPGTFADLWTTPILSPTPLCSGAAAV